MKDITEPKHIFKVGFDAIEKRFGKSNADNYVEVLHFIIYQTFGSDDFKLEVDFDTKNDNPYFHNVCCVVTGIDSATAGLVKNDLIKQGLID